MAVSSELLPVSTIASTSGESSLALAMTSMPLRPGMSRSTRMQSKLLHLERGGGGEAVWANGHAVAHPRNLELHQLLQRALVVGEEQRQALGFRGRRFCDGVLVVVMAGREFYCGVRIEKELGGLGLRLR